MQTHLLAASALLLISCGGSDGKGGDSGAGGPGGATTSPTSTTTPTTVPTTAPTTTSAGLDCTVTPSDLIESVFHVAWSGTEGTSYVEYGLDGALDQRTPTTESSSEHSIAVIGLKAGRSYAVRGVTETADGEVLTCAATTVAVPLTPQALRRFTQTMAPGDTAQSTNGHYLTSLIQEDTAWTVILDADADYVWWYETPVDSIVVTSRPSLDGQSIMWGEYDREKAEDIGVVRSVRLDGTDTSNTRTYLGHHGFIEHADGTLGWLGLEFRDVDVDEGPKKTLLRLATDRILEAPLGSQEELGFADLYNMFDDSGMFPGVNCDHQSSGFDRYGEVDIHEWTHTNSFMYIPEEDAYYLYSKYTDTLLKVNRNGGGDSAATLEWQMGGEDGDFTHPDGSPVWQGVDRSDLWSHGHMSHIWPGGFALFDNGDHHPDKVSSIAEYAFDEATRTVERVWHFPDPDGDWTAAMGDVRKLETGNYVAGWSSLGRINEVDPNLNQKVWEIQGDLGVIVGRVVWIEDLYDAR
jgi:hypothetical protein